jgi:hypothetical protein
VGNKAQTTSAHGFVPEKKTYPPQKSKRKSDKTVKRKLQSGWGLVAVRLRVIAVWNRSLHGHTVD